MLLPEPLFKTGWAQAPRRSIRRQRDIMGFLHTPAPGVCRAGELRSALFASHAQPCSPSRVILFARHHNAPPHAAQLLFCRYAARQDRATPKGPEE
ncbi:hypothetical protein AD952_10245 [Acetobacter cerevisiae]|uniref:Uncharacterized protein n=1 Tax=Acetobacter cerevisiae TaxID=178900 RepID=A0A149UT76_9PROT|nr:hypothetical protein AD952_10245 [Acetobacter cerevisiae]